MNWILKHKIFLICSLIYLLSVLIVSPWGNYPIGDDLYYFIQVKAFQNGIFTKSGYIDTAIILQIFLGYFWSFIFGLSFVSLRVLTIICTLILIYLLTKILEILKISTNLSILGILILIFNPKLYYLSLSFNSEVYFLTFLIFSYYLILKFESSKKFKFLFLAYLIAGFSVMIRQQGILFILPLILVTYLNFKELDFKTKKIRFLILFIGFILPSILGIFWPKQITPFESNSRSVLGVIDYLAIYEKLSNVWKEIPYVSILLLPFIPVFLKKISLKSLVITLILAVTLSIPIYKHGTLSIGNITYLEGFDAKAYFKINNNLFNNNLFKLLFSFVTSLSFLSFIYFNFKNFKVLKQSVDLKITYFIGLVYLGSIVLAGVLYERYYLYFETFSVLGLLIILKQIDLKVSKFNIGVVVFLIILTTLYAFDFHKDLKMKWDMARLVVDKYNISIDKVYFNDNYSKFNYMYKKNNLLGLGPTMPVASEFTCFIKTNYVTKPNFFNNFISLIDRKISRIISNESLDVSYTRSNFKNCSKCEILFKQHYYSPLYDWYGVSKVLKAYCVNLN